MFSRLSKSAISCISFLILLFSAFNASGYTEVRCTHPPDPELLNSSLVKDTSINLVSATPNPVDSLGIVELAFNISTVTFSNTVQVPAYLQSCETCDMGSLGQFKICLGSCPPLSCSPPVYTQIEAGSITSYQVTWNPTGKIVVQQNGATIGTVSSIFNPNQTPVPAPAPGKVTISTSSTPIDMSVKFTTPVIGQSGNVNFSAQFIPDAYPGIKNFYNSNTLSINSNLNPTVLQSVINVINTIILSD